MLVPSTPYIPPASPQIDETQDFVTAIRLLAGKDCLRDASQAQMLLVRLSESSDEVISEDAKTVMKAALRKGWLENTVPKYYELENLAQGALSRPSLKKREQQVVITAALGVAALIAGVAVYLFLQGAEGNLILPTLIGFLILAIAVKFAIKQRA